jgi:hypothetical protein
MATNDTAITDIIDDGPRHFHFNVGSAILPYGMKDAHDDA